MDGLVVLLIIDAAIFAPVGAWLAQSKGRAAAEGAIVGAVLGILGILVIGLAPAVGPQPLPTQQWPVASLRQCPRCAEWIQWAATGGATWQVEQAGAIEFR